MSDRSLVLVLSNDFSPAAAKTSRHLGSALERLGHGAIGRDTRLVRWAAADVEKESPARREAYETMAVAKWNKFVFDYGFDTIIGLDLNWLFSSQLFLEADKIKRIHSFWFEDLQTRLQAASMFSTGAQTIVDLANSPKVRHHAFGPAQARELAALGLRQISTSALAAPAEFLEVSEPLSVPGKLAFMGDPGLGVPPSAAALAALERGQNLSAVRLLARREILDALPDGEPTVSWIQQCPSVLNLLSAATELRLAHRQISAFSLLDQAGVDFPEARLFLGSHHLDLEACLLIKAVNRYDRLAIVLRLWRRGWLDVFGSTNLWKPYGIAAQPVVSFPRVAAYYRKYAGHLHLPHFLRDGSPDEQFFESAACARAVFSLDHPDLRTCYGKDEVVLADSDEELEAAVETMIRDPAETLAVGEKARRRTASEHLWEHRLKKAFA